MAYFNEDGLEALVGKIKGQVISLTSAEYQQLPATKNSDNKLYFVSDETYSYQIDDEPTANSTGLVKSGGVYNWTSKIGSGTLTTNAKTLIPAVNEVNAAVDELNNGLSSTAVTNIVVRMPGASSDQVLINANVRIELLKLISLDFNGMTTVSTMNPGTVYNIGAISRKPYRDIELELNRQDGGMACGTLVLGADGRLQILPLQTIPSGVNLRAYAMYFYM